MKVWVVGIVVAGSCAVGCRGDTFECQSDDQCGPGGACEGIGYCSFPDAECESGRRYGELAPPDLRGRCVGAEVETSGGSSTTAPPTTSSDPGTVGTMTSGVTTTPLSSDGSSSASTGGAACDGDLRCYEDAPAGWGGPFRLVVGDLDGAGDGEGCPSTDPNQVDEVYADIAAQGFECTCECAADYDCATIPVFNPPNTGDCSYSTPLGGLLPVDTCIPIAAGSYDPSTALVITWDAWLDNLGTPCGVASPPPPIPPAMWATVGHVCDDGVGQRCGQGHCLQEAGGPICVYREGTRNCPAGQYSERFIYHRTLADDRECNDCDCQPSGTEPLCSLAFFDDGTCLVEFEIATSDDGFSCFDLSTFPPAFSLLLTQPAVCAAEDPGSSGTAEARDPVTFCCAP